MNKAWKWIIVGIVLIILAEGLFLKWAFSHPDYKTPEALAKCSAILTDAQLQSAFPGQFGPLDISGLIFKKAGDFSCRFSAETINVGDDFAAFDVNTKECAPPAPGFDVDNKGTSRPWCTTVATGKKQGVHDIDTVTNRDRGGNWKPIGDWESIQAQHGMNKDTSNGESYFMSSADVDIESGKAGINGIISFSKETPNLERFLRDLTKRAKIAYDTTGIIGEWDKCMLGADEPSCDRYDFYVDGRYQYVPETTALQPFKGWQLVERSGTYVYDTVNNTLNLHETSNVYALNASFSKDPALRSPMLLYEKFERRNVNPPKDTTLKTSDGRLLDTMTINNIDYTRVIDNPNYSWPKSDQELESGQ